MARLQATETDNGPALRWGDDGTPHIFEPGNEESLLSAVAKAVNDGVESGGEIEGEVAQLVAEVLKASGDLVWNEEDGFRDLLADLQAALPQNKLDGCPSPFSVRDVSLSANKALVTYYAPEGTSDDSDGRQLFVVPFKLGDDNDPELAPQSEWTEVEVTQNYVEKGALLAIPAIIKSAGQVIWSANESFNSKMRAVEAALPEPDSKDAYIYVSDLQVGGASALICISDRGTYKRYVVPLTWLDNGEAVIPPKGNWTEVEEQVEYTEKAGRKFSQRHLDSMKQAHEALTNLIAVGEAERAKPEEKPTAKAALLAELDDDGEDGELTYAITKSTDDARFTLGPLYAPHKLDAHNEWAEGETLQKSLWEYVRDSAESGRRINLQHGDHGDIQVGEWVECVTWPYEQTVKMSKADGSEYEVTLPAGTVYLGVVWDEDAWPLVKKGKLNGYSLGGRAVKVKSALPVEKASFKKHGYVAQDDGGGDCKVCHQSQGDGNHE